jgi:predicted flap endonuclease-1-like 5' DNA nuclease
MAKITYIEGIGPASAEKLAKAGIKTVEGLLKTCAAKAGRKSTAESSGIAESSILEWTNMADLFRIKGVSSQYAELLKAAGVDTVKELRTRNAANLHAKMKEVNEAKSLVRQLASPAQVEKFVELAKTLDPVITH